MDSGCSHCFWNLVSLVSHKHQLSGLKNIQCGMLEEHLGSQNDNRRRASTVTGSFVQMRFYI